MSTPDLQRKLHLGVAGLGTLFDRFHGLFIALICVAYAGVAAIAATQKALWFDELFTFHVAQLDGFGAIWSALAQGVDNHPPLDYWLRHVSMRSFGTSEVVFRLPSIIAFGVAFFCLVRFVARRSSPSCGLFAGLILLSTQSHRYAYEGRAYAWLIAFGSLSLLCWQLATEKKRLALVGLSVSLAAAFYSHYYGVLLFVPLVLGEIWRSFERRRVAWSIWLAFALGIAPLVALLPLIKAARQYTAGFWSPVDARTLIGIYSNIFGASALVLLVLLCWLVLKRGSHSPATDVPKAPPAYEIAAALGYLLLPFVCYLMAKTVTGALLSRYVVPAVIGGAVLPSWAIYRLGKNTGLAIPAGVMCLLVTGAVTWVDAYKQVLKKPGIEQRLKELNQNLPADPREPVVIANPIEFAQWSHYAGAELRARLVYVASIEDSMSLNETDTLDRALLGVRSLLPSRIVEYRQFAQQAPRFRMVLPHDSWQFKKVLQDRATITAVGILRGQPVYEVVCRPDRSSR